MSVHPCFEVSGGALDSFLPAFSTLDRPYDAYPLVCSNAHVETIFANKLRSSPYVRYRRECLRTSDNGVVALDWVAGDDKCLSPKSPILILLAGLTGGSGESYIKHMLLRARNKGWRVVAFNSRGCGDSPVITPKFYSASFTGDIGEAVAHISSRYPEANLYAAGWSLGANILVRYMGQEGKSCLLSGAVSLGNPFNLVIANSDFHKGFKRVYNKTLSASLSKNFRRHAPLFEEIEGDYNIPAACNSKSIREFDESLTRVTFGFKSADDYYMKSSSADSIKHVCTPLLCIQAENDPISPTRAIPRADIEAGLTGGSGESYIKHMLSRARNKGWRVVVFNSRGCGDSPVLTPQFYSASFVGDIGEVVVHISSRYPDANLYAAGWSLGANILVRYLGQEGESCLLSGAVSLGNPFNLVLADEDFHKGFNRVYDKVLSASLSKIFRRHALLFEDIGGDYNIPVALNSKSVREFDESLTRVAFGFKSVDDYYLKASSSNSIKHVSTPLLCIQAANDPIAPARGIPRADIEDNPNCMLIVTPKGGHLAWVAGNEAPFGAPWTDPVVMEFLEHLEKTKSTSVSK